MNVFLIFPTVDRFSILPFLVLLGAFVWLSRFLNAETFHLLLGLFGKIVRIGDARVFWLGGFDSLGSFSFGSTRAKTIISGCSRPRVYKPWRALRSSFVPFGCPASRGRIPFPFFFFRSCNRLASFFVIPFCFTGGCTPALVNLLRVLATSGLLVAARKS